MGLGTGELHLGAAQVAALNVRVRAALPGEEAILTDLCMRSKAHHGYDDAFMAQCAPVLEVRGADIAAGRVWVAQRKGRIVGTVGITPEGDGEAELDRMFVEPDAIGSGVGRALMRRAVKESRAAGVRKLMILADPHAALFYERCGAVRIGDEASDAIPGRTLPRYELLVIR